MRGGSQTHTLAPSSENSFGRVFRKHLQGQKHGLEPVSRCSVICSLSWNESPDVCRALALPALHFLNDCAPFQISSRHQLCPEPVLS